MGTSGSPADDSQRLFEAMPLAAVVTRQGRAAHLFSNERAQKLFGTQRQPALLDMGPRFWADRHRQLEIDSTLATTGQVNDAIAELRAADGRSFWGSLSVSELTWKGEVGLLWIIEDISSLRQAEDRLRRSESSLRSLLALAPTPMLVAREVDGCVLLANHRAAHFLECAESDLVGQRFGSLCAVASEREAFRSRLAVDGFVEGLELRLVAIRGSEHTVIAAAKLGEYSGELVILMSLTPPSSSTVEIVSPSQPASDVLPGLVDGGPLARMCNLEIERARRYGRVLCLGLIEIDGLEAISRAYGEKRANLVLHDVARVCLAAVREVDQVGLSDHDRIGVLLPETALVGATRLFERLSEQVAKERLGALSIGPTVSIGVSEMLPTDETLSDLVRRAELGLEAARAAGRGCVRVA